MKNARLITAPGRIDRLRYHPNHQTLIRKLEELLIREALS
jgi:hypothetical protein